MVKHIWAAALCLSQFVACAAFAKPNYYCAEEYTDTKDNIWMGVCITPLMRDIVVVAENLDDEAKEVIFEKCWIKLGDEHKQDFLFDLTKKWEIMSFIMIPQVDVSLATRFRTAGMHHDIKCTYRVERGNVKTLKPSIKPSIVPIIH